MSHIDINVIVFTYNQAQLLERTIKSVLQQQKFIHKLIISDDASIDNTRSLVMEMSKSSPKIIYKRNSKNLGINKHLIKIFQYCDGDLNYIIAGDDLFENGIFRKATNFIIDNKLNPSKEAFTIYMDYAFEHNGKRKIISNKLIEDYNPIKLKIRNLISNRSMAFSKRLSEKIEIPSKIKNHFADGIIDIQIQLNSDIDYYINHVGSTYNKGIGVSTDSNKNKYAGKLEMYEFYLKNNYFVDSNDINWLKYNINKYRLYLGYESSYIFKTLLFLLKSISGIISIKLFLKEAASMLFFFCKKLIKR